jgi:predicted CXXCH cytochrome family protein
MRFGKYLLVAASVVAVSGTTVMAAGVLGTPHDFSDTNGVFTSSEGEICLPCHIPHNANPDIAPLWNHAVPASADFTLHSTNDVLGGESLACLGCHDGQTAIDNYGGVTNGTEFMTGSANVGRDLSDDHPVGVEYGTSTRRAAVGTIWGGHAGIAGTWGNVPLYGTDNTVECASCHTPHDNDNGNFLRIDNAGSHLCATCHTVQYDGGA